MGASSPAASPLAGLQSIQGQAAAFADGRLTPFGVVVPKYATPIFAYGNVVVPAYGFGNQIVVAQYQAQADFFCLICGLVFGFSGSGPAPNPGDSIWRVDVDCPLGTTEGYPLKDYGAVARVLGSFVPGDPWPVDYRFENGELIRVKAYSVANMGTGTGNLFEACLVGYEWPKGGFEG